MLNLVQATNPGSLVKTFPIGLRLRNLIVLRRAGYLLSRPTYLGSHPDMDERTDLSTRQYPSHYLRIPEKDAAEQEAEFWRVLS